MSSLLEITPSTIAARLATGDLKAVTPAELKTLLSMPRCLYSNSVQNGTPATLDRTLLDSYFIPGGTLANDGDSIHANLAGNTSSNANTKRLEIVFDGITLYDSTAIASNLQPWLQDIFIMRSGAAAAIILAKFGQFNNAAVLSGINISAFTPTWASDVLLEIYGTNGTGAANDLTSEFVKIDFCPAPS